MTRNLALSAVAGGLMSLAAALAVAQDSAVLDDLYGRGVHAYFSRDSRTAVALLSEAIANGSQDPRAYYYRGLALRTLGREEDAALDFKEGAKLEQTGDIVTDVISKSLERVQGGVRMQLEAYRRLARLQTRNDRLVRAKQRYEEIESEDKRVLRNPGAPRPAAPPPAVAPAPGVRDPFSTEEPDSALPPPAEATEPDADTPPTPNPPQDAEAPPKPAKKPAAADPFNDDPAEAPAEEPPPKPKPAAKPADADPFSENAADENAEEMPDEEKPAAKPKPKPAAKPADADPFSENAGDENPEEMPDEEKPAAKPAPKADDGAAAAPAGKSSKAGRSLFSAIGRAILASDDAAKPAAVSKPAIDTTNAKDPFADDAPAPPVKAVATPAKKPAPATEIEDPFK